MKPIPHLSTALLLAMTAGCAATDEQPPSPANQARVIVFEAGSLPALTVVLPAGFTVQRLQGIDSQVARINGPGTIINIDYGAVGGRQSCATLPSCSDGRQLVEGREVTWTIERKPVEVAGQSYQEQMHLFVPLRSTDGASATPQVGARFDAACAASCEIARQMGLSARL